MGPWGGADLRFL